MNTINNNNDVIERKVENIENKDEYSLKLNFVSTRLNNDTIKVGDILSSLVVAIFKNGYHKDTITIDEVVTDIVDGITYKDVISISSNNTLCKRIKNVLGIKPKLFKEFKNIEINQLQLNLVGNEADLKNASASLLTVFKILGLKGITKRSYIVKDEDCYIFQRDEFMKQLKYTTYQY